MDNYQRARTLMEQHKDVLQKIADELLVREVLDADQVKRIVQGLPLDEYVPTAAAAACRRVAAQGTAGAAAAWCRRSAVR